MVHVELWGWGLPKRPRVCRAGCCPVTRPTAPTSGPPLPPRAAAGTAREYRGGNACSSHHHPSVGTYVYKTDNLLINTALADKYAIKSKSIADSPGQERMLWRICHGGRIATGGRYFLILWEEKTRGICKTPMTCVKSVFLSRFYSALSGTKVSPKSVLQSFVSPAGWCIFDTPLKWNLWDVPSWILKHRVSFTERHALQRCCHLVPEKVALHLPPLLSRPYWKMIWKCQSSCEVSPTSPDRRA